MCTVLTLETGDAPEDARRQALLDRDVAASPTQASSFDFPPTPAPASSPSGSVSGSSPGPGPGLRGRGRGLGGAGARGFSVRRAGQSTRAAAAAAAHTPEYRRVERVVAALLKAGVRPTIPNLDGQIRREGSCAEAGGNFNDVWVGRWVGGRKVALKQLRLVQSDEKAVFVSSVPSLRRGQLG
jgi:hypothetical protein